MSSAMGPSPPLTPHPLPKGRGGSQGSVSKGNSLNGCDGDFFEMRILRMRKKEISSLFLEGTQNGLRSVEIEMLFKIQGSVEDPDKVDVLVLVDLIHNAVMTVK